MSVCIPDSVPPKHFKYQKIRLDRLFTMSRQQHGNALLIPLRVATFFYRGTAWTTSVLTPQLEPNRLARRQR